MALLAAIGICIVAAGLYTVIEECEEEVTARWSIEALLNPFLAAERFLQKSDIGVVEVEGLVGIETLDGVSTLFVSEANLVVSEAQLERVMAWLEQGGNVIYAANFVAHEDDLLLDRFDVDVEWYDYDEDDHDAKAEATQESLAEKMREYNRQIEEGKTREEITETEGRDNALTTVDFDDGSGQLEIDFDDRLTLVQPYIEDDDVDDTVAQPVSWAYSDYGVHMVQFDVGAGLLTIVSDPGIWTSYRIDHYDHAFLLWKLSASGGSFAILHPVLQNSLWDLTVEHASELLIAAALIIAVWIWHLSYRFGRLVSRDTTRTRALAEHFSSISHYLWHRRHGEYLLQPIRHRIQRRAGLILGEYAGADSGRQTELLAERCDRSQQAVARAMHQSDFNEAGFVQTVKLLKHIEQSL